MRGFRRQIIRSAFLGIGILLLTGLAAPPPAGAVDDPWQAMKKPGHVVLVRHANAPETVTESEDMDLKNCAIQRNLDEAGRAQARRIGDAFRARGIRRVRLVSSQFCRAIDTAKLMNLGPVQQSSLLNIVYLSRPAAMREAAEKTRQFMKTIPAGQLAVLVTHVGNIQAIAGVMVASGEMVVVHFDPAGTVVVDGRITVP
jgi:phosphohistidine phosphatase SixA